MAGKEFTEAEILAVINQGRAAAERLTAAKMIDTIYAGVAAEQRVSANQLVTLINKVINNNRLVDGFVGIICSRTNEAMVALINSHNPYTSNNIGDMTIFSGNSDPEEKTDNKISQIELEVDGPYSMAMEWNFKGSSQKINKTLRIKYRYRARDLEKPERPLIEPPHWVTAYLLIGFEDGGA